MSASWPTAFGSYHADQQFPQQLLTAFALRCGQTLPYFLPDEGQLLLAWLLSASARLHRRILLSGLMQQHDAP